MRMPEAWLGESAQDRMADRGASAYAPVPLWAAMSALAGGQAPDRYMCRMESNEGTTEWRALWLVGGCVVYAAITKRDERWTAYSQDDEPRDMLPDSLVAWSRPVAELISVGLTAVDVTHGRVMGGDKEWGWSAVAELTFQDGTQLAVPPFGRSDSPDSDQEVQGFLDALASRR